MKNLISIVLLSVCTNVMAQATTIVDNTGSTVKVCQVVCTELGCRVVCY